MRLPYSRYNTRILREVEKEFSKIKLSIHSKFFYKMKVVVLLKKQTHSIPLQNSARELRVQRGAGRGKFGHPKCKASLIHLCPPH